jgi:hypothetical protein
VRDKRLIQSTSARRVVVGELGVMFMYCWYSWEFLGSVLLHADAEPALHGLVMYVQWINAKLQFCFLLARVDIFI